MGGDHAPGMAVQGAALALKEQPDLRFLMFGERGLVEPLVHAVPALAAVSEVRHTETVVKSTDRPSQALRQGRDSSMRQAIDAVAAGEAQGVVSAGNTGALMAMSKFVLKTLPDIDRPAICSTIPTMRGDCAMLDLGANIVCDEKNLVQFAIMGAAFARTVLDVKKPTVGLLNVGEEELKGNEAVRAAATLLREGEPPFEFYGFIEGDDIAKGVTDVVVTDGFSGNVALKAMEGTSKLYSHYLRSAFEANWLARLGYLLARPAMAALRRRVDPRRYNGGVFLGLNGVSVKSHGGADEVGFATAVELAGNMIRDDLIGRISTNLAQFGDTKSDQKAVVS